MCEVTQLKCGCTTYVWDQPMCVTPHCVISLCVMSECGGWFGTTTSKGLNSDCEYIALTLHHNACLRTQQERKARRPCHNLYVLVFWVQISKLQANVWYRRYYPIEMGFFTRNTDVDGQVFLTIRIRSKKVEFRPTVKGSKLYSFTWFRELWSLETW